MRPQCLAVLLGLMGTTTLAAQDRPAEIVAPGPVRYPEILRAAGIGGVVRALVVVMPGDSVAADGVRVVSAPHPGFRNAVIAALQQWGYRGAIRSGAPVADSLSVEIEFELGGREALEFGPATVRSFGRVADGTWHVAVGPLLVRGKGRTLSGARRDSIALVSARYLAEGLAKTEGGGARIACVTLRAERGADPLTAEELAALQTPGVAIVHPGRCPPKFASMVYVVGRVIPPGSDPSNIVVRGVEEYPGRWVVVRVDVGGMGAGYEYFDCLIGGSPPGRVEACMLRGAVVY
jgi:hypothetical protein